MEEIFRSKRRDRCNPVRRGLACVFGLLALIFFWGTVLTEPFFAESPYVYDQYGLFTEEEDQELEEACRAFHDAHPELEAYFVTVDNETAGGTSDWYTQEYIEQFAQAHSDGNSIAMIINMESRYYYVDVYGDRATACYPYRQQDKIRASIEDRLYDGEYYEAVTTFLSQAEAYSSDSRMEGFGIVDIGICLAVGAVAALAITGVRASKHKNVRMKTDARNYVASGSLRFRVRNDRFIRTYQTRVRKAETRSGGGGGTSAGHSSGHSGGGGHF